MGKKNVAASGGKWIRPEKRRAIYLRDNLECIYCGKGIEDGIVFTLDHVTPQVLGESNHESNLVTCCRKCNSAKGKLSLRNFLATLRDQGVDTEKLGTKIRRNTRRSLKKYKTMAKAGR